MTRFRLMSLTVALMIATSLGSWGQALISIRIGPPPLPSYEQPMDPDPNYIWIPGYWAYAPDDGYFWVPGTWAMAPEPGYLWTPGYWGYNDGLYNWYPGYWAPEVGYYGGIDYGYGYPGDGYYGGYWRGNDFYYNRAVNNVPEGPNIHVYNRTVVNNVNVTRVSYNGGPGGVQARPTQAQLQTRNQHHAAPTSAQMQHEQLARSDRAQFAAVNHGRPATVATPKPGEFHASGANRANPPAGNRAESAPREGNSNARPAPRPPENGNSSARVEENNRQQERTPPPPAGRSEQQAREPDSQARETQNAHQPPRETQSAPVHSSNQNAARPPEGEGRNEPAPRPNGEASRSESRAEAPRPEPRPAGNAHEAAPPAHEAGPPAHEAGPPAHAAAPAHEGGRAPEGEQKPDEHPH